MASEMWRRFVRLREDGLSPRAAQRRLAGQIGVDAATISRTLKRAEWAEKRDGAMSSAMRKR
jgi:hypothetical protein